MEQGKTKEVENRMAHIDTSLGPSFSITIPAANSASSWLRCRSHHSLQAAKKLHKIYKIQVKFETFKNMAFSIYHWSSNRKTITNFWFLSHRTTKVPRIYHKEVILVFRFLGWFCFLQYLPWTFFSFVNNQLSVSSYEVKTQNLKVYKLEQLSWLINYLIQKEVSIDKEGLSSSIKASWYPGLWVLYIVFLHLLMLTFR